MNQNKIYKTNYGYNNPILLNKNERNIKMYVNQKTMTNKLSPTYNRSLMPSYYEDNITKIIHSSTIKKQGVINENDVDKIYKPNYRDVNNLSNSKYIFSKNTPEYINGRNQIITVFDNIKNEERNKSINYYKHKNIIKIPSSYNSDNENKIKSYNIKDGVLHVEKGSIQNVAKNMNTFHNKTNSNGKFINRLNNINYKEVASNVDDIKLLNKMLSAKISSSIKTNYEKSNILDHKKYTNIKVSKISIENKKNNIRKKENLKLAPKCETNNKDHKNMIIESMKVVKKPNDIKKNKTKIVQNKYKNSLPSYICLQFNDNSLNLNNGLKIFNDMITVDKNQKMKKWNGYEWDKMEKDFHFLIKARYDNKGNIWCINKSYEILKIMRNKLKNFGHLGKEEIIDIGFDKKNILWCINRKGQLLKWVKTKWNNIQYKGFHKIICFSFDKKGELWAINLKNELAIWNKKNKCWDEKYIKDNLKISCIDFDGDGKLWVVSNSGALLTYSNDQWINFGLVCLDELICISFKKL
ncbi:thioredoxin-like associated protein 2, putative [Plasmodium sp. gorilla clade G3]|nr:thioredoxin-like associated protein 2, putative [Plasmodium sp. gorilla clade G3]